MTSQKQQSASSTPAANPLLDIVLTRIHQALVITDAQRKVIYFNTAYEQLTGLRGNKILNQPLIINMAEREDPAFYQQLWQEVDRNQRWEGELWDHHVSGAAYLKHTSLEAISDASGQSYYVALFSDLSQQNLLTKREYLTHYDPLTELPNRILFRNRLGHEFNIAQRHNARTGLILLNLDRFKLINNAFGFAAGDRLLVEIAQRLQSTIRRTDLLARQEQRPERDSDLVSRIGGDDFSFILSELRKPDDASIVSLRLLKALEKPFYINDQEVYISASLGIAVYPDNAEDEDSLLQCAEFALLKAKHEGGRSYRFYSEDQNISSARRLQLETRMRNALDSHQFILYYQPQRNLRTGRIESMEALVRWPTEEGLIPPSEFIPLAEDSGLMGPLGRQILFQALADTVNFTRQTGYPIQVAVNLSVRQFQQPGLVELIQEALTETGIEAERLELEITEGMVIQQVEEATQTMQQLRALGVRLALDDFGTGYSSLAYLRHFPINTLKIDQTFTRDLSDAHSNTSIISAIIGLGKGLGMQVVAEGIETQPQLDLLTQAGCDYGQGYFISYPVPLAELVALFRQD